MVPGALWGLHEGIFCSMQGAAENPRNLRTLRLLCRDKKTCEIVGLHRRLKQTGGRSRTRIYDLHDVNVEECLYYQWFVKLFGKNSVNSVFI